MMTGASNRLMGLTKELRAEWDNTKQYWSDAKSSEFEKRFFDELITGVNQAVNNIETLERILKKIRDDCE
jgi:hypothetical protein